MNADEKSVKKAVVACMLACNAAGIGCGKVESDKRMPTTAPLDTGREYRVPDSDGFSGVIPQTEPLMPCNKTVSERARLTVTKGVMASACSIRDAVGANSSESVSTRTAIKMSEDGSTDVISVAAKKANDQDWRDVKSITQIELSGIQLPIGRSCVSVITVRIPDE